MKVLALSLLVSLIVSPLHGQDTFTNRFCSAAMDLTKQDVTYDPTYYRISYPNGDIPAGRGVCTDVIIRAYRKLGVDLQKLVHEDMRKDFSVYPDIWGLRSPDPNIDHRRVPNLMTFFSRHGSKLPVTPNAEDYRPGDIVTWDLGHNTPHIGIVVDRRSRDNQRYLIVHNIGAGQVLADCLFDFKITGHFRYEVGD